MHYTVCVMTNQFIYDKQTLSNIPMNTDIYVLLCPEFHLKLSQYKFIRFFILHSCVLQKVLEFKVTKTVAAS